jgi:hypothetical protein
MICITLSDSLAVPCRLMAKAASKRRTMNVVNLCGRMICGNQFMELRLFLKSSISLDSFSCDAPTLRNIGFYSICSTTTVCVRFWCSNSLVWPSSPEPRFSRRMRRRQKSSVPPKYLAGRSPFSQPLRTKSPKSKLPPSSPPRKISIQSF